MEESLRANHRRGQSDHSFTKTKMARRSGTCKVRGFSLVEMLIIVAILSIVSSVVITHTMGSGSDAAAAAGARDLQTIARAAARYYSRFELWPRSTFGEQGQGGFQNLVNRETFTRIPPMAATDTARYGWFAWQDRFAAAYAILVKPEEAILIDELIDDGNAGRGNVRVYQATSPEGDAATIVFWLRYPGL